MENLELLEKKISYSVKKLVAINSISFCYIELPIDQHCALFGRNNLGKTSLLNVLKLHLFPEISFNDCENKFAFKSSKGELYSGEDSYQYYFPSNSSFLILEAENIHGTFCLILFKSNSSFGYQRLALPCSYNEIREQFWDIEQSQVNNGLGAPVNDLGLAKIDQLYKQYRSQGAVILKSTKEIKERLFNHSPLQRAKGRFCLVPLKEAGVTRELNAFRQLMNFTFDIAKTDTKGLTETFATIIESGKINSQDRLHQDVQQILDEYKSLRSAEEALKNVVQHQSDFERLTVTQQKLTADQILFSQTFQGYDSALQQSLKNTRLEIDQLEPKIQALLSQKESTKSQADEYKNCLSELNGQLKTLCKQFKELDEKATRYQQIKEEFPSAFNDIEIQEALNENKKELSEKIEILADSELAIKKLAQALALQKENQIAKEMKLSAVTGYENNFIHSLECHSATVLDNLSPRFSEISATADEAQQKCIKAFAALFSSEGNQLHFLGALFSQAPLKQPHEILPRLKRDLEDLEAEHSKRALEIKALHQATKNSGSSQKVEIEALVAELQTLKTDLGILHTIEEINSKWHSQKAEIEEIEREQTQTQAALDEATEALKENSDQLNQQKEHVRHHKSQLEILTRNEQRLQQLKPTEFIEAEATIVSSVTESDLDALEGEASKIMTITEKLNRQFSEFIQCGHFNLPFEMALNHYDRAQKESLLFALQAIFSALPEQQGALESRIIEHNKMTGTKISELAGNRDHIRAFSQRINKQFGHYSISNLQEIRVEIELDSRFEELINELDNTNLNTTDIHDDGLYQRLNTFCEEFFVGHRGNRILEMRKIIKNVHYSYKKPHQDKREAKDQSTGTNALINCTLLTILLSDLLSKDSRLTLPIIFDEFTALDEYNQRTAIKAATEHGFSLFCASPTDTAEVVSVVDYYIHLDDFHADTLYDNSGERNIVFHHFKERLYKLSGQAE
jgi:hypothetical protein